MENVMYTQCTLYTVQQCLLYCQVVSELHIEDAFAGGQADSGLRPKQQKKHASVSKQGYSSLVNHTVE
jgi:hypothetical protein